MATSAKEALTGKLLLQEILSSTSFFAYIRNESSPFVPQSHECLCMCRWYMCQHVVGPVTDVKIRKITNCKTNDLGDV